MAIRQVKVQIELTKDNQTTWNPETPLIIDVPALLAVAEGDAETITAEHSLGTLIYTTVTDTQENLAEWDDCKRAKRNEKRWAKMREFTDKMKDTIDPSYGDSMRRAMYHNDAEELEFYLQRMEYLVSRVRKTIESLEA